MLTSYCLLDESGDPGLLQLGTSSPYFILVMVQFENADIVPELDALRQEMGFASSYEFKYYKAKAQLREIFFKAIQPVSFTAYAIVLDKSAVTLHYALTSGSQIFVEMFADLIANIPEVTLQENILIVDGATAHLNQLLRKRLSRLYKETNRVRAFKKIVTRHSHQSNGLQLADMIAGAIRHSVTEQDDQYYRAIKNKLGCFIWFQAK